MLKQQTKEWHDFRRNHIGASDAPVIMGVSPWKNVKQLYSEKTSCTEIPDNSTASMRRGLELESIALDIFEAETGYLMEPRVLVHASIDFMSASFDGVALDNKCIVEIKCPGIKDHERALDNQVPEKYIPQLNHQMEVFGVNRMYYMSFVSEQDYKIFEVKKDDDYTKQLIQKEHEFWEMVRARKFYLPIEDIHRMECEEWKTLSERWKDNQNKKKMLEQEEEKIKSSLLELANYNSSEGFGLEIKKVIRKGAVDYTNMPMLKGVNLEPFRKASSEYWKLNIKNEREMMEYPKNG